MRFAFPWTAWVFAGAMCISAGAAVSPSQRLGCEFMRTATTRTMADPLTVDGLAAAIMLAQEAIQLDPDNADYWRLLLDMSTLAERDDLKQQCVQELSRLDPDDESIQLMRLNAAIDRFQTVNERAQAYERLLAPENADRLEPAVASRLALDCALLHRRQGDIETFSRWLSEALKLDSSNRSAAAIATGFFRMNVHDAVGEAELLTNLLLADPTDISTQVALAQLLLEHGAYVGADRLYRLAVQSSLAGRNYPSNDMLTDRAVAQWANGDDAGALETLRQRQADMDLVFRSNARNKALQEKRDVDELELNALAAPVNPTQATVAAAIHKSKNDDLAASSIAAAVSAYQRDIDAVKSGTTTKPEASEIARAYLEMAWIGVWLGGDLEQVQKSIVAADALEPLSQQAKDRFEGWLAYRRGDSAKAIELLSPLEGQDVASRLGLAMAFLDQQRTQDAARQLLSVNREQPGTLIGIWAAGKLAELLHQRMPLSDQAVKLEELVASIPVSIDRYPRDGSLAIGLRVVSPKLTFQAYEPITFDLEITNNSMLPLALDQDGPLRPQVMIAPVVRTSNARIVGELRAFIVNVGRHLRLAPREKMTVTVNLRMYHPGDALNLLALNGSIIKLTALMNFVVGPGGNSEPGLYGREVEGPLMRLEGESVSDEWIVKTTAALQQPNVDLPLMALFSHVIAPRPKRDATDEDRQRIDAGRTAFSQAYAKLEPAAQAWLLSVMPADPGPASEGIQPVLAMAKKSENRLVQIAYVLYQAVGPRDPMFDAALRGEDSVLKALAQIVQSDMIQAASQPARSK